jgi:Ca2+-binding RTX toxin-like protein/predicted extracellular nuclease
MTTKPLRTGKVAEYVLGDSGALQGDSLNVLSALAGKAGGPASIIAPGPANLAPTAGGIAFTGFNADGTDDIAFVAIQALDAGTVIYFTDNEWNGAAFTDAAEGLLSLTLTSAVAAGTIVTISSMSAAATRTSSTGTLTAITNSVNLNANDEVLYAYLANSGTPTVPTTFLAAFASGGYSAANGVLTNTGLTAGTNAIDISGLFNDFDIAAYNGGRSGQASYAAYLSIINTASNWIAQDGAGNQDQDTTAPDIPFSPTGFTITGGGETQTVVFNPVTVTQNEGNSGTTAYGFTVTRTGGTTGQLNFSGTIAPGTTDNADYVGGTAPTTFSGSILAGQTSATVTVNVQGDYTIESSESFSLTLTAASNSDGTVTTNIGTNLTATGNITNDDTPGTLSIGDVIKAEGDSGTTHFDFTVTRSGGATGAVGATWTLNAPGGAGNADSADFIPAQGLTGTVSFAEGETSKTVTIDVQGDAIDEGNENFTVTLSVPTGGAALGDSSGLGTITNDDAPPALSVSDVSFAEGNGGVTYMVFTVSLNKVAVGTVTVDYQTSPGTAADGTDFLGVAGQVSIAAGQLTGTFSVPIIGDANPENNETLTVALSNPVGATINDGSAIGTITNDDGPGYYPLGSGSFSQNWSPNTQITADDNWSGVPYIIGYLGDIDPTGASTSVDPRTLTGAALGAIDVIANQTSTTILNGGVGEFHLTNPVVGLQGSGTADAPSLVLYMDASGRSSIRLQATLRDIDNSAPGGTEDNAAQQINVQYRTSPTGSWTNVPGAYFPDVTALGASTDTPLDVILPAGANNAATLEIRIMTTNAAGSDEWVGIDDIVVSSLVGSPTLSIADAAVFEGNSGTTPLVFTVTRTGDTSGAVTADYSVVFGSGPFGAVAGDFAGPLTGQVSFGIGETSATITIGVQGDATPEGDDGFTVVLSNPSPGAAIGDGTAIGTIVNDDGPPILVSIGDASVVEGNSGSVNLVFTVTRTGGTGAFNVDFQTSDGTASSVSGPGQDYVTTSGQVNFLAGEMSKTISVPVLGDTVSEINETFQVTLTSATNGALIADANATGTIVSDDPIYIHDIQGTSYFSPILAGENINSFNTASAGTVLVRAVITAIDNDGPRQGFYIQEEVTDWDSNNFTSEGIFVMTRNDDGVGPAIADLGVNIAVGDLVTVTAHVMEYQENFASPNMPITVLTNQTSILVNSSGNVLPTLLLDAGHPMPTAIMTLVQPDHTDSSDGVGDSFDASLYALSFWETVEGMLVTIPAMVVADGFVSTSGGQPFFQAYSQVHADADQINSRGGYTIAGDPPIGPPDTLETVDDTIAGGRHLSDGDINPDIVEVDFTGFAVDAPVGFASTVSMGDYLGDLTGIIEFDHIDRKLFVTSYNPGSFVDHTTTQDVTILGDDSRSLTVATFNVENLDPSDPLSKFQGLAAAIANNLNMPDIISIEEMQDNNGAAVGDGIDDDPITTGMQDTTGADASQTWQMLVDALNAATGAHYQWVDQEPTYNAEGGEQSGNIRVGFLYNTDRVQLGDLDANATLAERRMYTDRIGDGTRDSGDLIAYSDDMLGAEIQTSDWSSTRRSLLGEFTFNGNTVYVTANHFPAKSGSDDFWQFLQNPAAGEPTNGAWSQRNAVAQDVYSMLNLIETGAPGTGIVSGGDYNDFYFYRPLTTVTGYTMADGTARVGGTRLQNLTLTLSEAERYTYNFDGRSQAIDHIVVNGTLGAVATYDVVHLNTGFNSSSTTPLSDHDPGLSSFDYRNFSEVLTGTAGADVIMGFGGNDTINGGGGDDTLYGDGGNDGLIGGTGADGLYGGTGDDAFFFDDPGDYAIEAANAGQDIAFTTVTNALIAGSEVEILSAFDNNGVGALDLFGNELANQLWGNEGVNYLNGGGGADILVGLGGDDTMIGGAGSDYLDGGAGADALYGSDGDDLIVAGIGNDYLDGGTGADGLYGGDGNDTYFLDNAGDYAVEGAAGGQDIAYASVSLGLAAGSEIEILTALDNNGVGALDLFGNELANQLWGNAGVNYLNGGGGADVLVGFGGGDTMIGGAGNDYLDGGAGADALYGSEGDDLIVAGIGNDYLDGGTGVDGLYGGDGNDTYFLDNVGDYAIEAAGGGQDIAYTTVSYGLAAGSQVEILSALDNNGIAALDLFGNELANQLWGNAGVNYLNGGAGDDALLGFGGDDTLIGGAGNDYLEGGAGADIYAFITAPGAGNVDIIAGFASGSDRIVLDHNAFGGLSTGFLGGAFASGTQAGEADDRIIYDSASGSLYYDADGNGAGAAVQFATLAPGTTLLASDFFVT